MFGELYINIFDMVMCISSAIELVNPTINNHHCRVTYIALSIAEELNLSDELKKDITFAAGLHDIGILSIRETSDIFKFNDYSNSFLHAIRGEKLLDRFDLFKSVSKIIKYHHSEWKTIENAGDIDDRTRLLASILHLSDKVDTLILKNLDILAQSEYVREMFSSKEAKRFNPIIVKAFLEVSKKEAFWLELEHPLLNKTIEHKTKYFLKLDIEKMLNMSMFFSHIIDFRSRFTSSHSSGVAATAEGLLKLFYFSEQECKAMRIAGYLHDLGKLAIPGEIIEKPGKLTKDETFIIRKHTFYTYKILDNITGIDQIKYWAAQHHERLDGSGYPFRKKADELSQGSRIMAVADVFTAITEDRPYRKGMCPKEALKVIENMALNGALDPFIVSILKNNFDEINGIRIIAQSQAIQTYDSIEDELCSV